MKHKLVEAFRESNIQNIFSAEKLRTKILLLYHIGEGYNFGQTFYMLTAKELLTTYWNNLLIIFAMIGFVIKWFFDLRGKKIETKYSLFQQNKIGAITKFYSCFTTVHRMWDSFDIYKVLNNKHSVIDMDRIVTPPHHDLKVCIYELSLYFNEEEMELFNSVEKKLVSINHFVYDVFFGNNTGENINIANKFRTVREDAIKESEALLQNVGRMMRKKFNND